MNDLRNQLRGLWLPLITPFRDRELDAASLRRLVRHYANGSVDGLILAATSGEGLTLSTTELERLVMLVRAELDDMRESLPLCLGLSGASTGKLQDALDETAAWPIDGYLIASPYYSRPSQRGLLQHFTALADHASWPIVLYNIPYRSAVNLHVDTLLALPNIKTSQA
jgi:4-hydroxy-tetrahydrodipicolinate synthase